MSNAIPFVAAIVERTYKGKKQLLIQTRYKPQFESIYNGTFEFVAGQLDKVYENIYDTLAREITEETGMTFKCIIDDSRTEVFKPQRIDGAFGFRPFCCVQQLRDGRPWIGFIFRCEVEDGEPNDQLGETKDVHWIDAASVKEMLRTTPEKLFTLEIPAWHYYFNEVSV